MSEFFAIAHILALPVVYILFFVVVLILLIKPLLRYISVSNKVNATKKVYAARAEKVQTTMEFDTKDFGTDELLDEETEGNDEIANVKAVAAKLAGNAPVRRNDDKDYFDADDARNQIRSWLDKD